MLKPRNQKRFSLVRRCFVRIGYRGKKCHGIQIRKNISATSLDVVINDIPYCPIGIVYLFLVDEQGNFVKNGVAHA